MLLRTHRRTSTFLASILIAAFLTGSGHAAIAAEDTEASHRALLGTQLAKFEKSRPTITELYVLAAGMSSKQDVFKNDVESMRALLDQLWGAQNRSVSLVASERTRSLYAYPNRANLTRAAEAIGTVIDPRKDVLLLFLTSHGTSEGLRGTLPGEREFAFSPVDVRKLLEASRAKFRVVIVSACHAAVVMNEIADDNTLVIAASHATRTSFGCNFTNVHTWFTGAFLEGLAATGNFEEAFRVAAMRIEQKELGGEAFEASMPQIHVGSAIRSKVAEIERRASKQHDWEPPVLKTEEGKLVQMMGDYFGVATVGKNPQVVTLRLRKLLTPSGRTYPVEVWGNRFYSGGGEFVATYDADTRTLSGTSKALGDIRFTYGNNELRGSIQIDGGKSLDLTLKKALRKEVYEAVAKNPPEKLKAKPNSRIRLLYIGAQDCSYCLSWERDHIAHGQLTKMPEYSSIEFLTSKRYSLREKLRSGDLPDGMEKYYPLIEKYAPRALRISPSFVLMVDDEIRMFQIGPFLDSPIYPVLRAAVAEKKQ